MNCREVLEAASAHLTSLSGHVFDLLTVSKPISPSAAVNLAKVVSKLSPLLGNLIEFNTVEFLNDQPEFGPLGTWKRQDPGFPDTIFEGSVNPAPGFEIKAWFPLATEITARFKDSQNHFTDDQTYVCMLAWLPEQLIFGKPRIIDVCIVSGLSVAQARDDHYHNPPDYLVLEPEDTKARTRNLQQTNTNGYKWQGTARQFQEAQRLVQSWGPGGTRYKPTAEYQGLLRQLIAQYPYRLDTNFAKMDRIVHQGIEDFKRRVLTTEIHGLTIGDWSRLLYRGSDEDIRRVLEDRFDIKEADTDEILR
ncbi:hypothetical protein EDC22_11310 [Tepidamorphus gemmatus]|uniref:Uncharacterized protein n=1 Tax=Tepidamorphus gemmatus TaxID=747076 RepID=A0A4R3LZQ7_9HYPH|nr:hypothetical protein [Tepidamorphus gemmatus]TCT05389.1 hypothetical protein EDC22_11310 [Tepidamorphus gemmatus]